VADGKIVLKGIIELLSPALIGSGNDEHSDCDVILDADGKPFIPATSFIGVLRHHIKPSRYDNELKKFWGFADDNKNSSQSSINSSQSSIICSDLYCDNSAKPSVRDGIKINGKTGIVEIDKKKKTGKKYDYEVIEKGAKFKLEIEISFSDKTKAFCEQMAVTICDILKNDSTIRIGAKTNSGLGKIELKNEKLYKYNFTNKQDVFKWLMRKEGSPFSATKFTLEKSVFIINAILKLKNSFIIRSYSEDVNVPDSTSIKSGKDFVITGTSLKGAIRSRAERIANTLGKKGIIENLFGYVKEDDPLDKAKKGRIQIDEVRLPDYTSEMQSRIKIDRFTGGVMPGALFDSMPLFSKDEEIKNVKITITNYKNYEAGLMLLILKDLWTGDLAIGGEKNVGRGVFEGIEADVCWDKKTVKLKKGLEGLSEIDKKDLEEFVSALRDYQEGVKDE